MPTGRPTKLTPGKQQEIAAALQRGAYLETAAAYAGVARSTLFDWLRRGQREKDRVAANPRARIRKREAPFVEFSDAIEKAMAHAEVNSLQRIERAADQGTWQADAWRLERRWPERWGRVDRNRVEISDGQEEEPRGGRSPADEIMERLLAMRGRIEEQEQDDDSEG